MNSYGIGTLVRITGTFRDLSGTLTDPTAVTFEISLPTKELDTANTSKDSTGVYHADYVPTIKGGYTYKMLGNSSCQVGAYGYFNAIGDF